MKRWKSDISTIINSFKRGSTLPLMWNLFTYFILALASCETNSFQFEEDYTQSNTGAIKYLIVTQVSEKINSLTAQACVTQRKNKKALHWNTYPNYLFRWTSAKTTTKLFAGTKCNSTILHVFHVFVFNEICNYGN